MSKAFFPGTFDPVTNGHLDLIKRAASVFGELAVGVYDASHKDTLFTLEQRVELMRSAVAGIGGVSVGSFSGLTVAAAQEQGAAFLVRGLRIGSDFEYERGMALTNRELNAQVDTVCLMSSLEYQFLSSSRVKEVARLGGNVASMVPQNVADALKKQMA